MAEPLEPALASCLLALRARDSQMRAELLRSGDLFEGYAPAMEKVHVENATDLEGIIDRHRWPGTSLVGGDGADAAWLVAQHAISLPAFQRRCLRLLADAVARGDAPPRHQAFLTDRIRYNERRPQVYGTIFDWDADGKLSPWIIEAPERVDRRRAGVGLPPLAEAIERHRADAEAESPPSPAAYAARQRDIDAWARRVGWVSSNT